MTTKHAGRAIAANDARPVSKNDLSNEMKLSHPPTQSQQLFETQTTCTSCARRADTLYLFIIVRHLAALVEVRRLCGRYTQRGRKAPRVAKRALLRTALRFNAFQKGRAS